MPASRVARLNPEDAAYLAGLIDGEGTIALSRRHARENRQLVLSISSTEAALVEWARAPFLRSYKRARADLVLRAYVAVTPRNGKYTARAREARKQFEAEFASLSIRRSARETHGTGEPQGPRVTGSPRSTQAR